MSLAPVEVLEEDAADLQFPKGSFKTQPNVYFGQIRVRFRRQQVKSNN